MPRKAAATVTEGDSSAPRRSSRISAIAKTVEAPLKKIAKPRKKKGAAEENAEEKKEGAEEENAVAATEERENKENAAASAEEPAPAEVNGTKRKASEAPEGKPASKRAKPASKVNVKPPSKAQEKPVSKASNKPNSKAERASSQKPGSRAGSRKPPSKVGNGDAAQTSLAPETITEENEE